MTLREIEAALRVQCGMSGKKAVELADALQVERERIEAEMMKLRAMTAWPKPPRPAVVCGGCGADLTNWPTSSAAHTCYAEKP